MDKKLEILNPRVRRSKENERDVIQKTAKALGERFKTDFIWIEEILHNTVVMHSKIEKYIETGKECENGVLSDFAIDANFRPSILEPLSVLGAKNTKKLFCVSDGSAQEKYADGILKYHSRVLTTDEYKAHESIHNCWLLSYAILRDLPPPDNSKTGKRIFGDNEEETLQSFKKYLKQQKQAIVIGDINNRDQFSEYPCLDCNFLDGQLQKIILYKSLLKIDSPSLEENRFFKNEKERIEYSKKDQEQILIPSRKAELPILYTCALKVEDKFEINELVQERDIELREKLFGFRLFAIDVLIDCLVGKKRQDPTDILTDYVLREFSKSEIKALDGKNPEFFGLKANTVYTHKESNCFYKIIQAVNLFFGLNDSRLANNLYIDFEEIFKFSKEIEGPHQLWFSYYDYLFLLSSKPEISGQLINKVTADCENMAMAINRFAAIESRIGRMISKISKQETGVANLSVANQLNSFAENEYGQTNLALPYLDEILSSGKGSKKATGVFLNNFRDYKPRNQKIPPIRFTKKQSKAIEVLYNAFNKDGYGLVRRSVLIEEIYGREKAKHIASKSSQKLERISPRPVKGSKKKGVRNKIIYKNRYEWRLEKVLFKSTHPAWIYGMVKFGVKVAGEKTYRICFDFDRPK